MLTFARFALATQLSHCKYKNMYKKVYIHVVIKKNDRKQTRICSRSTKGRHTHSKQFQYTRFKLNPCFIYSM